MDIYVCVCRCMCMCVNVGVGVSMCACVWMCVDVCVCVGICHHMKILRAKHFSLHIISSVMRYTVYSNYLQSRLFYCPTVPFLPFSSNLIIFLLILKI